MARIRSRPDDYGLKRWANSDKFIARLQEDLYVFLRVEAADKEHGIPASRERVYGEWIGSRAVLEFAQIETDTDLDHLAGVEPGILC
jgi:hypothetical protein